MRFVVLFVLMVLAPARAAGQPGINLAWSQCYSENGTIDRGSSCAADTGTNIAVGSFRLGADQPQFSGLEVAIDLLTSTPTLPDWWQFFNVGSCRLTALTARFDFAGFPGTECTDPWQGQAFGAIAAYRTSTTSPPNPVPGPNRARILLAAAIQEPALLPADVELYGFQMVISNARTSVCVGCEEGACLYLRQISAVEADGSRQELTNPIENQIITWQGAPGQCATPARRTSWGQIKGLYR